MHRTAFVFILLLFSACAYYDPTPGTIHLQTTYAGQPRACMAQVWNAAGKQLQNVGIEGDGRTVDIEVPPGTYTLKFQGHDGNLYPAVVEVKLYEAGEVSLTVELSEKRPPGTVYNGSPTESGAPSASPDGG